MEKYKAEIDFLKNKAEYFRKIDFNISADEYEYAAKLLQELVDMLNMPS